MRSIRPPRPTLCCYLTVCNKYFFFSSTFLFLTSSLAAWGHLRVLGQLRPPLFHLVLLVRRSVELNKPVEVEPGSEGVVGLARGVVAFGVLPCVWPGVEAAILDLFGIQLHGNQLDAIAVGEGDPAAIIAHHA
jgi:hypothetical protein